MVCDQNSDDMSCYMTARDVYGCSWYCKKMVRKKETKKVPLMTFNYALLRINIHCGGGGICADNGPLG